MKLRYAALAAFLVTGTAHARDDLKARMLDLAGDLAPVLASERPCNLEFDQSAIRAYIDRKVPADNFEFLVFLMGQVEGSEIRLEELPTGARTAHCRAAENTARHYGFIK